MYGTGNSSRRISSYASVRPIPRRVAASSTVYVPTFLESLMPAVYRGCETPRNARRPVYPGMPTAGGWLPKIERFGPLTATTVGLKKSTMVGGGGGERP